MTLAPEGVISPADLPTTDHELGRFPPIVRYGLWCAAGPDARSYGPSFATPPFRPRRGLRDALPRCAEEGDLGTVDVTDPHFSVSWLSRTVQITAVMLSLFTQSKGDTVNHRITAQKDQRQS